MKTESEVLSSLLLAFSLITGLHGHAFAQRPLSTEVGQTAVLIDGGQAAEPGIRTVGAMQGGEVLEAFVYVTQNGNQ